MSLIIEVLKLIRWVIPKRISLDVIKEPISKGCIISVQNTTGKSIQIENITVNELDIYTDFYVKEKDRGKKFPLQKNQIIYFTFSYNKKDTKPHSIQFYIKRTFRKPKKINVVL